MDKNELISTKGAEQHYFQKRIVRIASACLALLLAVLFAVAFANGFNVRIAMFENGNALGDVVFYASFLATALVFAITPILVKKEMQQESALPESDRYENYYKLDNTFVRVFRICAAVLTLSQGVVSAMADLRSGMGALRIVGMLLLSLCLAVYFLPELTEMLGSAGKRVHTVIGMISLLWFVLNTVFTYMQRDFAFSSKYFTLSSVGYVLFLLAFTYEMRYRIDGKYLRARLASSCGAFVFGFGFSVGRIVMLISNGQISLRDTSSIIVCFVISLYFGIRIFFYEEN